MMVDDLGPEGGHRRRHTFFIADVQPEHLRLAVDVAFAAGAEVVEDRYLVPGRDVGVGDV